MQFLNAWAGRERCFARQKLIWLNTQRRAALKRSTCHPSLTLHLGDGRAGGQEGKGHILTALPWGTDCFQLNQKGQKLFQSQFCCLPGLCFFELRALQTHHYTVAFSFQQQTRNLILAAIPGTGELFHRN